MLGACFSTSAHLIGQSSILLRMILPRLKSIIDKNTKAEDNNVRQFILNVFQELYSFEQHSNFNHDSNNNHCHLVENNLLSVLPEY